MSKIPVRLLTTRTIATADPQSSQTPKEDASAGAGSEASQMDQVSSKLANLSTAEAPRTAQLDQNPFDDDESDDEQDLTEYTEEEIGCVTPHRATIRAVD